MKLQAQTRRGDTCSIHAAALPPAAPRPRPRGAALRAAREHQTGGATDPTAATAVPRRAAIALLAAGPLAAAAAAAGVPPPPAELGEAEGTLNDCPYGAVSCASSMSDDDSLFYAPWEYEGARGAAVEQLILVRCGT
jgi:hypothetical protein